RNLTAKDPAQPGACRGSQPLEELFSQLVAAISQFGRHVLDQAALHHGHPVGPDAPYACLVLEEFELRGSCSLSNGIPDVADSAQSPPFGGILWQFSRRCVLTRCKHQEALPGQQSLASAARSGAAGRCII